jgi:pyridoxine 5-phosphate synthase
MSQKPMLRLSVNVNKVATLRNSRGANVPNVLEAVETIVDAGCLGITVHPRSDERHIRRSDVYEIAQWLRRRAPEVEYNIEGAPESQWLEMVCDVVPAQATLVPVKPGEITSSAGWDIEQDSSALAKTVADLKARGIRVSVFIDAHVEAVHWAAQVGADRIELYTEPYARAFERDGVASEVWATYAKCSSLAHSLGLGVNAGHDLDLANLPLFATIAELSEVSIGHALISRALYVGLDKVVREYLDVIAQATANRVRR